MKRKFVIIAVLCIIAINLTSCSGIGEDDIRVVSSDYPDLKRMAPGEFDENWVYDIDDPYHHNNCYVTSKNGELLISNQTWPKLSHTEMFNSGYFVGVNLDLYDGWVKYYEYHSNALYNSEGILVADENCCAIIKLDENNGYILTYDYLTEDDIQGRVYRMKRTPEKGDGVWTWQKIASFDGFAFNYFYSEDESKIYIVTDKNILTVNSDGKVEVIVESEVLKKCSPNSITRIGDAIYCGSRRGVYKYDTKLSKATWYPMEYSKYAP